MSDEQQKMSYVAIRYWTKAGGYIDWCYEFYDDFDLERWNIDKFIMDRIAHEQGWFPYDSGRISIDALLKIEEIGIYINGEEF